MANKQIYQLTETLSVSPDDWLAIDLDSSNLTRKARVGNVFSVSEGSSYTGGTADGIMFNDGNTFGTSSNLVFDGAKLIINNPATNPATVYIKSDGTTGLGGDRVFALEGNLPELWFKDTFGGGSGMAIRKYNNQFYIVNTNSSGAFVNYVSNVELSSGKWTIGAGNNPLGQLDVKVQSAGSIGQVINLANGQTADAFQINSYGNTGGDLFKVESDGKTSAAISVSGVSNDILEYAYTSTSGYDSGSFALGQSYNRATISIRSGSSSATFGLQGSNLQIGTQNVGSIDFLTRYFGFQTSLSGGYYNFKDNNGDTILYLDNNTKSVGIGTTSIDASAKFQIDSTTQGALLPRMTTTERDAIPSPATGLSIFNTTTAQPEYYSGTAWEGAAGGGVSIGDSVSFANANRILFSDQFSTLRDSDRLQYNHGSGLVPTGTNNSSIENVIIGHNAGSNNTATDAVLLGYLAGSGINSGSSVAIGRESLRSAYGASDGVYVGKYTGYQSNGTRAIALGYNSFRLAVGNLCVAVGEHTLYGSNGDSNVAVGQNALNSSTGGLNTAIGARAMLSATSVNSTAVGYQAGQGNSGDYVLALGHNAGNSNTQANRFIIGQQNLPQFAGAAAAADPTTGLPAASANGVYLYWDTTDNTIKARP